LEYPSIYRFIARKPGANFTIIHQRIDPDFKMQFHIIHSINKGIIGFCLPAKLFPVIGIRRGIKQLTNPLIIGIMIGIFNAKGNAFAGTEYTVIGVVVKDFLRAI
jgi:hypothetical protein